MTLDLLVFVKTKVLNRICLSFILLTGRHFFTLSLPLACGTSYSKSTFCFVHNEHARHDGHDFHLHTPIFIKEQKFKKKK